MLSTLFVASTAAARLDLNIVNDPIICMVSFNLLKVAVIHFVELKWDIRLMGRGSGGIELICLLV